eukprot:TRINITY_DN7165_c0_g1_i1.p1 TRINITY_DN7165_c0_g1~~TRINITY_DN7165_c0_g1_i1.p1  ORF type:complete len:211 (-),score=30.37 TRINITY_DN7165_c0_g1_i1:399-1031(-)
MCAVRTANFGAAVQWECSGQLVEIDINSCTRPRAWVPFIIIGARWYSRTIKDLVQSLLIKDIRKRPYIDDIIDLMIIRGFKLREKDRENLQKYRKTKLQFKMRNVNKSSASFQVLVQRLQKNIMDASPCNLRFPQPAKLEEEVMQERLRSMREKALNKRIFMRESKQLSGFNDYCVQVAETKERLSQQLSEHYYDNYIKRSFPSSPSVRY